MPHSSVHPPRDASESDARRTDPEWWTRWSTTKEGRERAIDELKSDEHWGIRWTNDGWQVVIDMRPFGDDDVKVGRLQRRRRRRS